MLGPIICSRLKASFSFHKITPKTLKLLPHILVCHCTSLSPWFIILDKNNFVNVSHHYWIPIWAPKYSMLKSWSARDSISWLQLSCSQDNLTLSKFESSKRSHKGQYRTFPRFWLTCIIPHHFFTCYNIVTIIATCRLCQQCWLGPESPILYRICLQSQWL